MADRTVRVVLSANINQYRAAMQQAAHTTAEFGRELTTNSKRSNELMQDMGRGAMLAGAGLVAGFAIAGRAAMNFDQQMSAVAAATMATADDLDALRQAALDAGQATSFSATESAAAIENLAKAGISTADILGGALSGSLDLAAAGGLGVADAAEIAATALTQFDLNGSQVAHVADLLAAGAGKAQGDVSDLGMALRQSGLVAAQTGLTIEETTAALSAFASAGLLGSDAGTSLKSMLQRLTPTSAESAEKMDQLGFSAFDAQGNFIGLTGLAGEMQSSFGDLTVEQRNLAMATIFGSDAVRAAGVLFDEGATGIAHWQNEVNDAGYAADVARIRMDNLGGDVEQLGGALETALITGGSKATGALRTMTQATTAAVNAFSEAPGWMQATAVGLTGVAGAALTTAGAIAYGLPKFYELVDRLFELGPAGAKAASALTSLASGALVVGGIVAVGTAIYGLSEALGHAHHSLEEFTSAADDELVSMFDRLVLAAEHFGTSSEEVFRALAESSYGTAQRLRDNMAAAGDDVSAFDGILRDVRTTQQQSAADAQATSEALAVQGEAYQQVASDAEAAAQSIENLMDAQRAAIDPLFGMLDAVTGNRDAQLAANDANAEALIALNELNHAVHDHGRNSDEATAAQRKYEDALRAVQGAQTDAATSALDVHQASIELSAAIQNGTVSVSDATAMLQAWVGQGLITADQAAAVADQFAGVAEQADDLEGRNVSITLHAATEDATASINQLDQRLQRLSRGVTVPVWMVQHGSINQIEHSGAGGGFVPDTGHGSDVDSVPSLLMPGEFVIRKSAAQRIGAGNLFALNRMAGGGVVGAGHAFATFTNNMIGNLSGTPVGRNAVRAAGPGGDPSGDLKRILDLYIELSDTLGQAAADQILWSTQTVEGFELVGQGALDAQEAIDEAAEAAAEVAHEHERIHDVMFAVGDLSTGDYLAMLNQRLAATEEYSNEWFDIWQQINRITEDAAAEEREILEERERELEKTLDTLSQMYTRAADEFDRQQEAYADAVAERSRRILEEVTRFRDGIVGVFRQAVNPVDLFGSSEAVSGGEVEAALKHRLEAAKRFAQTYGELAGRGINQDVLTQLAQRGPEGLSLAQALLKVDPALVNEAMSQTAALGGQVADVALSWERARIEQQVYAEVALPVVQSMNELLAEEMRLHDENLIRQEQARAWAEGMAAQTLPALAGGYKNASDAAWDLVAAQAALAAYGAGGDGFKVMADINVTAPAGFGVSTSVRAGNAKGAVGQVGQRLVMNQKR